MICFHWRVKDTQRRYHIDYIKIFRLAKTTAQYHLVATRQRRIVRYPVCHRGARQHTVSSDQPVPGYSVAHDRWSVDHFGVEHAGGHHVFSFHYGECVFFRITRCDPSFRRTRHGRRKHPTRHRQFHFHIYLCHYHKDRLGKRFLRAKRPLPLFSQHDCRHRLPDCCTDPLGARTIDTRTLGRHDGQGIC